MVFNVINTMRTIDKPSDKSKLKNLKVNIHTIMPNFHLMYYTLALHAWVNLATVTNNK